MSKPDAVLQNLTEYHKTALKAAVAASKEIMRHYESDINIINKTDGSPVTSADYASTEIIEAILEETGIPIIGEESIQQDYSTRRKWPKCWCVDPLDGTIEFIKQNGEFAVNIALIENNRSVFGIITSPVEGKILFGSKEIGVFITDFDRYEIPEDWQKLTNKENINEPVIVTCSRSHHSGNTLTFLNDLKEKHTEIGFLKKGSSLKFFDLAFGNADVYPRFARTMEWDIAAGQAILEGLGGEVVHAESGLPLTYNKANLANPYFIAKTKAYKEFMNA